MSATPSLLHIPQQILDDMVAHAREMDPSECCGLLAGIQDRVARHYRIRNTVARDDRALEVFNDAKVKHLGRLPETAREEVAYFMDPTEMLAAFKDMRSRALDLLVIYHSHTHTAAYPSTTDVGLAYYPDAVYLIISLEDKRKPDVQAYRIKDRHVSPVEIRPFA